MAKICISKGRTYNTGNYESLRLDVSLEVDIAYEDVDEEFDVISTKVEKLLTELERRNHVKGR